MIEVLVGRNQLAKSKRRDAQSCAVALAIKEQTGFSDVYAGGGRIRIDNNIYTPSEKLRKWINAFDDSEPVKAIRLFLNKGEAWMETIGVTFMRKNTNQTLTELEDYTDGD